MFIFSDSRSRVAIFKSELSSIGAFSFPELSLGFKAIITNTRFTPRPVINPQGTIGGANYLSVFGEDPLQIEMSGAVVGAECDAATSAATAIGRSLTFYKANSIVNRVDPIKFTIGRVERQAFLVAMSIMQEENFADIASFTMLLLGKSLADFIPTAATPLRTAATPDIVLQTNTGIVTEAISQVPRSLPNTAITDSPLTSSGELLTPTVINIVSDELTPTNQSIRRVR